MPLSTTPENAISLGEVIKRASKKHGKLLLVLALVLVLFVSLHFLTKAKPTT